MKNTFKKLICVVMSLAMLIAIVPTSVLAANNWNNYTLKFNSDGKFRILQFSDTQDDVDARPAMIEFIKEAINKTRPNLVVFTGDNTSGGGSPTKTLAKVSIDKIIDPVRDAGIPFAIVFGNHDAEGGLSKEQLMNIYTSYNNCLANDAHPELSGCGTYNLPILSSNGQKVAFNLWMFDSGMYDEDSRLGGYDYVHDDQVDWYVNTSNALKQANGGTIVPSLAFQHIIPREIYDELLDVPAGTAGAISRNYFTGFNAAGEAQFITKNCILDPNNSAPGSSMREAPCPSTRYSRQVDAFISQGDVMGIVVGHDHINSYIVTRDLPNAASPIKKFDFIQTPGIGFQTYGDDQRGCRVIDLDESSPYTYETKTYGFFDIMGTTNKTQMLYYYSLEIGMYYLSYVFCLVPVIGPWLRNIFLEKVYLANNP